jgi:hypothetical protein
MNKKLTSFFLVLVLLMQQLPVTQVDAILLQEQMAEELPDGESSIPEVSVTEEVQKHFINDTYRHLIQCSELMVTAQLLHAEELVSRFFDDVETRPPNC